jgi:hypothetical protein
MNVLLQSKSGSVGFFLGLPALGFSGFGFCGDQCDGMQTLVGRFGGVRNEGLAQT